MPSIRWPSTPLAPSSRSGTMRKPAPPTPWQTVGRCGILDALPGLYDEEFVGFRVPSGDDLNVALREAVVAIDANVLLGLYRFLPQTANDLIKVLARFEDRLIVPHQALREFWRHRQRAAGSPAAATQVAGAAIGKAAASVTQALETWSKQVGLDASERTALLQRVTVFAEDLRDELAAVHEKADARAGDEDPILAQLERLLDGRVTSALPEKEWEECVIEGNRRAEAEEPPGYKDAAKQDSEVPEGAAGDYLVWYQATRIAAERGCDRHHRHLRREGRLVVAATDDAARTSPGTDPRVPQAQQPPASSCARRNC